MKCTHKWTAITDEAHWCEVCGSLWWPQDDEEPEKILQPELAFVAETGSAIADLYERVL